MDDRPRSTCTSQGRGWSPSEPAHHCLHDWDLHITASKNRDLGRLDWDVGPADRQLIAGTWGRCAADCDDVPPCYRVASGFSTPFQIQTTIFEFPEYRMQSSGKNSDFFHTLGYEICKNWFFFIPKRYFFIPSKTISYLEIFFHTFEFFVTPFNFFHTLKTFFIPSIQ
jgi:hypothetical protein